MSTRRPTAPRRVRVRITQHRVPWRVRRPLRIAHLTDVHVGWSTPSRVLHRAIEAVHASRPDLVVMTGDYVNYSLYQRERLRDFVRRLDRPCVATLGNHDHWTDPREIARVLEAEGIEVLQNRAFTVRKRGVELSVVGVDDGRTRQHDIDRAFFRVEHPSDTLVLSHAPSVADEIAAKGGRLILSGHTHGGHLAIPKLTPAVAKAAGEPYLAGHYPLGETRLYVNAGLGHSRAGLRAGQTARAEVAIFDLVPIGSNAGH